MTKAKKITCTAVFAAIATIMMYFEFPIPFMPPFLKVDLSGAVVLVGAFILGIAPAITMVGIKDLIHLTQTQTAGSGEAADFLMLSTLVIIAGLPRTQKPQNGGHRLCCRFGRDGVHGHAHQLFPDHSVLCKRHGLESGRYL